MENKLLVALGDIGGLVVDLQSFVDQNTGHSGEFVIPLLSQAKIIPYIATTIMHWWNIFSICSYVYLFTMEQPDLHEFKKILLYFEYSIARKTLVPSNICYHQFKAN